MNKKQIPQLIISLIITIVLLPLFFLNGRIDVGIIFLIVDIINIIVFIIIFANNKKTETAIADANMQNDKKLNTPASIKITRESSGMGSMFPYNIYINGNLIGSIANGGHIVYETNVSTNIIKASLFVTGASSLDGEKPFSGFVKLILSENDLAEIFIKAGRFQSKKQNITRKKGI